MDTVHKNIKKNIHDETCATYTVLCVCVCVCYGACARVMVRVRASMCVH